MIGNEHREEHPRCGDCALPLVRIFALEHPPADEIVPPRPQGPRGRFRRLFDWLSDWLLTGLVLAVMLFALAGPLLSLALDPTGGCSRSAWQRRCSSSR